VLKAWFPNNPCAIFTGLFQSKTLLPISSLLTGTTKFASFSQKRCEWESWNNRTKQCD